MPVFKSHNRASFPVPGIERGVVVIGIIIYLVITGTGSRNTVFNYITIQPVGKAAKLCKKPGRYGNIQLTGRTIIGVVADNRQRRPYRQTLLGFVLPKCVGE